MRGPAFGDQPSRAYGRGFYGKGSRIWRMEQKLVVLSADTHKDRDITGSIKDLLDDGWTVAQISAGAGPGTFIYLAVLLTRQKKGGGGSGEIPFGS